MNATESPLPIMPRPQDEAPLARNEALRRLYTRIIDAKAGFDVMVEKAEPEFAPVARKFRDLHERHAARIAELLHGDVPEDTSLLGTVAKTVVSLRAFFDEIDEDVMDQVRLGEKHVIDAFHDAQRETAALYASELAKMEAELQALLDATAHLD